MIRTIAKTTYDAHTDPIFQNLGILKFHDIYLIQLGLFMYSYQNHTLPLKFHCKFTLQSQIHSYNTRNSCKFRLPFCRTRTKQFSVFYQGPKFYNTLRWLKTVSNTYIWIGRYNHCLSFDATIMVSKNYPIISEQVVIIFLTQ